jgi:hypothetical protein
MGAAENRSKSQAHAEYMKQKGMTRKTGKCPWGCGATYATSPTGQGGGASLMNHLQKCQGGGKRRFKGVRT